jgi:ferritin-like metal-binding protein YciE
MDATPFCASREFFGSRTERHRPSFVESKRSRPREFAPHPESRERDMKMAKEKTLEDLFHDTLKDIYYAERKILKALPKMKRAAQSGELKAAFDKHQQETEGQIERLQQVFELMGKRAQGKTCDAIEGIIAEGEEILDEFKDTAALDAGLISAAQAVEHYEITRYGTLKRWATELDMADAAKLLDATLQEESKTDSDLTKLADASANNRAKARRAA